MTALTSAPAALVTLPLNRPAVGRRARTLTWAAGDLLAGVAGLAAAHLVSTVWTEPPPLWDRLTGPSAVLASAFMPVLWLGLLAGAHLHGAAPVPPGGRHRARDVAGCGLLLMAGGLGLAATLGVGVDPLELLVLALVATAGSTAVRVGVTILPGASLRRPRTRLLLVGHRRAVADLAAELEEDTAAEVVAVCLHRVGRKASFAVPVHPAASGIGEAVARSGADAVVVLPCHHVDRVALRRLAWDLEPSGTQLLIGPGLLDVATTRARLHPSARVPLLHVRAAELRGWRRTGKELWERSLALLLLIALAPLLAVLVTAVRLDSPGPAVFRQIRIGRDGSPFVLLKLRTMTTAAEAVRESLLEKSEADGPLFKIRHDPRITGVGGVLRRYSLDELPQLLNVVRGDMSLVGPRPPLPAEVETYDDVARRRLAVKPGLTGLWQVSGRSDLTWQQAVRLDVDYVENWTPWRDLVILARTPWAVVTHRGAY